MATYCNQLLLPKYWMLCEEKACQAWKPQTSRRQQGDQKLSCWAMCLDSSAPFKHAVPVPLFQDATGVAWTWNARSAKFPAFRRFGKNDAGHFDSTLAAYHFQTHASTFFEPSIRMSEPMVFIWSLFARERELWSGFSSKTYECSTWRKGLQNLRKKMTRCHIAFRLCTCSAGPLCDNTEVWLQEEGVALLEVVKDGAEAEAVAAWPSKWKSSH